jgi:hypothetical protein
MNDGQAERIGRLIGVVVVILLLVSLGVWFGWDSFLTLFGLPFIEYYRALGLTVLLAIPFGAVYLLKEDFRET